MFSRSINYLVSVAALTAIYTISALCLDLLFHLLLQLG